MRRFRAIVLVCCCALSLRAFGQESSEIPVDEDPDFVEEDDPDSPPILGEDEAEDEEAPSKPPPKKDPKKPPASSEDELLPLQPAQDEGAEDEEARDPPQQDALPKDTAPKDPLPKDQPKEPAIGTVRFTPPGKKDSTTSVTPVTPAAATEEQASISEEDLKKHIEARAAALRGGEQAPADAELSFIIEARKTLGARNVIIASASLIHEAAQAESQGKLERAVSLAETASALSPDLAEAHWRRASLYLAQDWSQLDKAIPAFVDFVGVKLSSFRNAISFLLNTLAVLGMALLATIFVFSLVQLYKYVRYAAHDLSHMLPSWFGTGEVILLLSIAIVLPLVFNLGIAITIALALGVVFIYQARHERVLSIASWALMALAPALIWTAAPLVTFHGSEVDAIDAAMSESFAHDAEARLLELAKSPQRFGVTGSLALAHRYRLRGQLKAAEAEYRRALTLEASNTVARNNLGTVLYAQGNEEAARATFQLAAGNGQRAEPLLNLASMLVDDGLFEDANASIERARQVDGDLADFYADHLSSLPTPEKLLVADMGQDLLWTRLYAVDPEVRDRVASQLFRTIGGTMPLWLLPLLCVGIAAVVIFIARRTETKPLSVACAKCGVPAPRDAPATYCEQCQSIFLKAIAVEPLLRIQKEEEVVSYQRRRRLTERLLAIVAGAGEMFAGRPALGALLLFLFVLALSVFRWSEGVVTNTWTVGYDADAHTLKLGAAIVVAALLSLFSVRQSFK